ncbi:MAG: hypothetical protein R8P61_34230 [Bacteroidia bacterium]|nr:hypothetical protein [Bacteroidia bacterium]
MDLLTIIEILAVAGVIALQFMVYSRNRREIASLSLVYPDFEDLKLFTEGSQENGSRGYSGQRITLLEDNQHFHPIFQEVVHTTNAYLRKNGGEADFDILKDMAERKSASQEHIVESTITLPLYIGLICTFAGVIVGLIKIAVVGVNDAAIQSFVGGVMIGMVGSAAGLGLTVRSNFLFKNAKKQHDQDQYNYFAFLRTYILPALPQSQTEPIAALRKNLASFNDGFATYQNHMNESLTETLRLFGDLKLVFKQIRNMEQGLSGVGNYLKDNDNLIEKQVVSLDGYTRKVEELTQKLEGHFTTAGNRIEHMIQENLHALDKSTLAAYVKMDRYLESIEDGDRKDFAEALNRDLKNIRGDVELLQSKSIEVNALLLEQLSYDNGEKEELGSQVRNMSKQLAEVIDKQHESFLNSKEMKVFVYSGVAAFNAGLAGIVIYLINNFVS